MHIHRNTLRYRLDPICEIAQLNMKDEQLKKQMLPSIYYFDLFPRIQGMSHLPPRGIAAKDRHGYHPNPYDVELIR